MLPSDSPNFSEDGLPDANGPAYQKTERRTGPPLDYVAEKMRSCIEQLHASIQTLREHEQSKKDGLSESVRSAFRYAVISYLALMNMLGVANNQSIFDRLLAMSPEDLREWIDRIHIEGSVIG